MNRKKIFEQRDLRKTLEKDTYEQQVASHAAELENKAQLGRQRFRNSSTADRHRGDSMKDLVGYKFADEYRDQKVSQKPNLVESCELSALRPAGDGRTNFKRGTRASRQKQTSRSSPSSCSSPTRASSQARPLLLTLTA